MRKQAITKLLILILAAALAACGDPATMASGQVVDEEGNPVEAVQVVLESEISGGYRKESEQKTDKDGRFNFVSVTGDASVLRLRFTKEGYREETVEIAPLQSTVKTVELTKSE